MPSQPRERRRSTLPFGVTWENLIIWTLFAGLVYVLRDFFGIVFITFIMSYMAQTLVGFIFRGQPREMEDHWLRRTVVLIIYLSSLAAGYLAAMSIVPLATAQGRWLLGQVQGIDLYQIRDEILAKTLGRIEFAQFRSSPTYAPELERFIREHLNTPSFADSKRIAGEIEAAFGREILAEEGRRALEDLKRTGDFDPLHRGWLKENRAAGELGRSPEVLRELDEQFDASWRLINGSEAFENERNRPEYLEKRHQVNLQTVAERLFAARRFQPEAETALAQDLGQQRVEALDPAARQERFRGWYHAHVSRTWPEFPFSFDQFILLDGLEREEEYHARLAVRDSGGEKPEERFEKYMQRKLAKEHSLMPVLGTSSQMVQKVLPTLTSWLSTAFNNLLSFGFNALLSMMFSFMIVWEIPRLRRGLNAVKGTRAERIYNEIAPGIYGLGIVVGRAFSAQVLIALINAMLTFAALVVLGLPSPEFLSLLVFVCCLIPYMGIFFAAVPILMVALQQGGTQLGFSTSLVLFGIHELEAWILSPKILGDFLQLSPIVLIFVLFVAQSLFGIWGLLLGVPVVVYLIKDVLLRPAGSAIAAGPGLPAGDGAWAADGTLEPEPTPGSPIPAGPPEAGGAGPPEVASDHAASAGRARTAP